MSGDRELVALGPKTEAQEIVTDWLNGCSPQAMPAIRFEQSELLQHLIATRLESLMEENARLAAEIKQLRSKGGAP